MTPLPRLNSRVSTSILVAILLLVAVACHKELVRWPNYLKTHFSVIFDWTDAPKANPSVMKFIAFPVDGSQMLEFGFTKNTGGEIDLAAGDYRGLAYNDDTESLLTRGDTWDTFEIYTRETSLGNYSKLFSSSRSVPRGTGSENETIIEEPDMLWTGFAPEVLRAGENSHETVTIRMQESVFVYKFVIEGVANLEFVTDIIATISGMSGSMFPSTGKASDTHYTIPVTVTKTGSTTLECVVRSFGHCPQLEGVEPQGSPNHHLMVYASLSDGSKWYYDFDVTAELHRSDNVTVDDNGNIEILVRLSELPFPRPISEDSGMHPEVEEWNDIEVDIHL